MGISSATVTVVRKPARARQSHARTNAWHAISIEVATGQTAWFVSSSKAKEFVPAAIQPGVLDARIAEKGIPSSITLNPGFDTGIASISGGTYKILDRKESFTAWLADKAINNRSVVNAILTQYTWEAGEELDLDRNKKYTFQIGNHDLIDKVYTLNCSDINREVDKTIFTPVSWRLKETIDSTTLRIPITVDPTELELITEAKELMFKHTEVYRVDPNKTIGYGLIQSGEKKEIFGYTDVVIDGNDVIFVCSARGVLQSNNAEWKVAEDTEPNNRQAITSFYYMEEPPLALSYALMTGWTLDGRKLPPPCSAGVDPKWVDKFSFVDRVSGKLRVVAGPKQVACKSYIEKQINIFQPCVLLPNHDGELAVILLEYTGGTDRSGAAIARLDRTNTDRSKLGAYKFDTSALRNPVYIEWGHQPLLDRYLKPTGWLDPDAKERYQTTKSITYKSDLLRSGQITESEIRTLAGLLYGRHAHPRPSLKVEASRSMDWLRPGMPVIVDLDVQDYVSGTGGVRAIERLMTIKTVRDNQLTGGLTLSLQGFTEAPPVLYASQRQLTVEDVMRGRTDINTLPGVTRSATGVLSGSPTISLATKYGSPQSVELGPNFNPIIVESGSQFSLHVFGVLIISTHLDVSERSKNSGGLRAQLSPDRAAQSGTVGGYNNSYAGGSWTLTYKYTRTGPNSEDEYQTHLNILKFDSSPASTEQARRPSALNITLGWQDGRLSGIPIDLSGSGGPGAELCQTKHLVYQKSTRLTVPHPDNPTTTLLGSDGGRGGAGVDLLSWPGSDIVGSGRITTSGGDVTYDAHSSHPGRPLAGPGTNGMLSWTIDGSGTRPTITGDNFKAHIGSAVGIRPRAGSTTVFVEAGLSASFQSYYAGAGPSVNNWKASHSIQYVPLKQGAEDEPTEATQFDLAFTNQRDNKINLIVTVTGAPPPDGNPGDMAISQANLDNTADKFPYALKMGNDGVWRVIDWATEYKAYSYLLDTSRSDGGNKIFNSETRPVEGTYQDGDLWRDKVNKVVWTLNTSGEDVIYARDGVQLGDERGGDPTFYETVIAGNPYYYFTDDETTLPIVSNPQVGTSLPILDVDSTDSDYQFFDPDLSPPTGVNALVYSPTSAGLNWTASSDASSISGYEVFLNGQPLTKTTALSHYIDNLSPGTSYKLAVRTYDGNGRVSSLIEVSIVTDSSGTVDQPDTSIPPPKNPSIIFYTSTNAELFWDLPSNTAGISGYRVIRNGTAIAVVAGGSHNMTDLEPSTEYAFEIHSLTALATSQSITLSVISPTDDGSGGGPPPDTTEPTITVNTDSVGSSTITGPTVSGATTNVEQNRKVWINHPSGGVNVSLNSDGTWSHTFPSTYASGRINPYVTDQAGTPAKSYGPYDYVKP